MGKRKEVVSNIITRIRNYWSTDGSAKDFSKYRNMRLTPEGEETLDPVPKAVHLAIRPPPTLEQRLKLMLREERLKAMPDYGLDDDTDLDDDDKFPTDDPMYDFERRQEEMDALQEELNAASRDMVALKEEYKKKRAEAVKKKEPQKEIIVTEPDEGGTEND